MALGLFTFGNVPTAWSGMPFAARLRVVAPQLQVDVLVAFTEALLLNALYARLQSTDAGLLLPLAALATVAGLLLPLVELVLATGSGAEPPPHPDSDKTIAKFTDNGKTFLRCIVALNMTNACHLQWKF